MVIMAVDLGKARTGIALCDKTELLASPLTQINEYNREKLLDKISDLAKEKRAELLVVGLPKNMDGSEGESARNARNFADELAEKTGLPVEMQDERGTTITAHNYLNATDTRGKKRKSVVDAVAATIILEDYLNRKHNSK
ncbi:MAG: Holliday junction resolvase RuvX [Ruminococcus sp.]|nr:Holliday junction resolvase RuvX [Ruminococcus sp.]